MTVRSSKLIMNREISSMSLLTGAITSLQRNLEPEEHVASKYDARTVRQNDIPQRGISILRYEVFMDSSRIGKIIA